MRYLKSYSEIYISCTTTILVHSDNCKSQYKLAEHISHLQRLTNEKEKQVLRVWSNAGHGKRKVLSVVWLRSPSREQYQVIK